MSTNTELTQVAEKECLFCLATEHDTFNDKSSICGSCYFFFVLKLNALSPSTVKQLLMQEKPISYLKNRMTDKRLTEETRTLINALLRKRIANLTKKKLCCSCESKCEHIGTTNKTGETKTYCCTCLPEEYHTKPQYKWRCPTCIIRKDLEYNQKWQCKDCSRYILDKKLGVHCCKFCVDYDKWNHDCPQFKPKKVFNITNHGRIIRYLERYYVLDTRATYAPELLEKMVNMGPSQWEILDDLIEAGCELIVGQVLQSKLIHGRSKKNTIIVPHLVINSEKVYEVDIPLSSNPRNYKPRKKAQVFYEMLEDHLDLDSSRRDSN